MFNARELDLLRRRDEILRETMDVTTDVVQSLEQQQRFALDTQENLYQQNRILSQANEKMRSMNDDLTSVVHEMNEMNVRHGCLCCHSRLRRKVKSHRSIDSKPRVVPMVQSELGNVTAMIPELIEKNNEEKRIVQQLNQMKRQFLVFQDQIKAINRSFDEGHEIIQQLGEETDQYMNASKYTELNF
jgi:hypothetical protein